MMKMVNGMIRIVEKDYGFDEEYVPISPKVDYFTGVQTKTAEERLFSRL